MCPCVLWCALSCRGTHLLSSLHHCRTLLSHAVAHGERITPVPITVRIRILLLCIRWCASLHLASPLYSSPFVPPSVPHSLVSSSSTHPSSRVVLESAVRTAVAALDREIQHLHEYRNNGASTRPAAPTVGAPTVAQHMQKIMGPPLHPRARAVAASSKHSPSAALPPSSCIRPPPISHGAISSLPLLLLFFLSLPRPPPFWGSIRIA